jgi:hypothetical protein
LEMVQFTVERLGDIRPLLISWRKVLAELEDNQAGLQGVSPTFRQVRVEVEHRKPGMEVLLTFLAPREVLRSLRPTSGTRDSPSRRNSSPRGPEPLPAAPGEEALRYYQNVRGKALKGASPAFYLWWSQELKGFPHFPAGGRALRGLRGTITGEARGLRVRGGSPRFGLYRGPDCLGAA